MVIFRVRFVCVLVVCVWCVHDIFEICKLISPHAGIVGKFGKVDEPKTFGSNRVTYSFNYSFIQTVNYRYISMFAVK